MAGTSGFFSNGPVLWMDNDTEMNNLYRDLELGTVLTLFYSKKSQRPERRTFQVKLETRTIIWTRGTDKIEGESEYTQKQTNTQTESSLIVVDVATSTTEQVGLHILTNMKSAVFCGAWMVHQRPDKIRWHCDPQMDDVS